MELDLGVHMNGGEGQSVSDLENFLSTVNRALTHRGQDPNVSASLWRHLSAHASFEAAVIDDRRVLLARDTNGDSGHQNEIKEMVLGVIAVSKIVRQLKTRAHFTMSSL